MRARDHPTENGSQAERKRVNDGLKEELKENNIRY